ELGREFDADVQRVAAGRMHESDRQTVLWIHACQTDPTTPPPARLDVTDPDPPHFLDQYRQRATHALATLLAGVVLPPGAGVAELIEATRFVADPRWRAELLAAAHVSAPPEQRDELLRAALGVAMTI